MPTPSIQTLVTDAQQILNLDSISAVRSVVAVALANANTGTPLNPNLTTQQLWNEFYQVVNKPKSDIESIIANQLMKFLFAPPAPGGVGANGQVIFNDGGVLAGDPQFLWNKTTNLLTVTGSATITGDLTVRTNKLAVTSTGVGIGTATPVTDLHIQSAGTASAEVRLAAAGGRSYNIGSTASGYGSANNLIIYDITGSAERWRLDANGNHFWSNVGGVAGTAMTLNSTGLGVFNSPVSALDVYKTANDTINRTNATFCFGQMTGLGAGLLGQQSASAPYQFNLQAANAANSVQFPLVLQPTGGNVGVGVTPSYKLDVAASAVRVKSAAAYSALLLSSDDANAGTRNWATATNFNNYGDFCIVQSNAIGGNPISAGTTRMTLDASGNLLVGRTSVLVGGTRCQIGNTTAANQYQLVLLNDGTVKNEMMYIGSGRQTFHAGVNPSDQYYVFNDSNVGVYLTNGGTSWTATSDERLKDIIEPINNAVAKVGSLRSVIGKFKTDSEGTRRSFLIAQDVQSALPEAVDSSNTDALGVRYTEVIPLLVAAIKELTARVEALEA